MAITILFFARLREQVGKREVTLPATQAPTVAQAWANTVAAPMPANLLAAVNHEYAALDAPLQDGDEVAFFPPVTGG